MVVKKEDTFCSAPPCLSPEIKSTACHILQLQSSCEGEITLHTAWEGKGHNYCNHYLGSLPEQFWAYTVRASQVDPYPVLPG